MKKFLLSAMALVAAMSVNAQEYAVFAEGNADFDALGLNSDGVALTAGTVIGQSESVIFKIGADDTYKTQNRGPITIGDVTFKGGLQGSSNPQGATGAPANALETPISGAYFEAEVTKDGFLYVLQFASSNKAYTIFEEGEAIGYTYSALVDPSKEAAIAALGKQYGFVIEGAGEYNWLKEAGYTKMLWPEQIYLNWDGDTENNPWTALSANGLGVIKFPVFAGCKYAINANGSKMTAIGYYFDETGDATVKATQKEGEEDVEYTLLNNGSLDGSTPAPVESHIYSVIGTLNGNWDTDDDLVKGADGLYTFTFENVAAGEYKFKVRQDHDWTINWGAGDDGDGNTVFTVEKDGSTVTIIFDPSGDGKVEYKLEAPADGDANTVWTNDGSKGAISWSSDYRFANEEKVTGEEIAAIPMDVWEKLKTTPFYVDLEGENPQIRVTTGWWDEGTTLSGNDIQPGNDLLTDNGDGKWTLKVEIATNETLLGLVDDHHLLFTGSGYTPTKIYFAEGGDEPDAIQTVKKTVADCAIYNLAGQKVNASYKGVVIKNGKKYLQK